MIYKNNQYSIKRKDLYKPLKRMANGPFSEITSYNKIDILDGYKFKMTKEYRDNEFKIVYTTLGLQLDKNKPTFRLLEEEYEMFYKNKKVSLADQDISKALIEYIYDKKKNHDRRVRDKIEDVFTLDYPISYEDEKIKTIPYPVEYDEQDNPIYNGGLVYEIRDEYHIVYDSKHKLYIPGNWEKHLFKVVDQMKKEKEANLEKRLKKY